MVGRNFAKRMFDTDHILLAPTRDQLNLLKFDDVVSFIEDNRPDIVIHAAGKVGGIKANIADPFGFLMENTVLGQNLINASKYCSVRKLINLGTSCMYPRDAVNPLEEHQVLSGHLEPTNEGYALAKIQILKLCEYITKQYEEFNYKTVIPCNLYGLYDNFDLTTGHLIPAVISKLDKAVKGGDTSVKIWGDGTARREFMFASDLADLLLLACENFETMPNIMNAGVGLDYSVRDYYEITADVTGYSGEFEYDYAQPTGMAQKLVCNKLALDWGWRPKTSLEHGICQTYDHYIGLGIE